MISISETLYQKQPEIFILFMKESAWTKEIAKRLFAESKSGLFQSKK